MGNHAKNKSAKQLAERRPTTNRKLHPHACPTDEKPAEKPKTGEMEFTSVVLQAESPLAGKRIGDLDFRVRYSAMLVAIERIDGSFETPSPDSVLAVGDNLWIVGNKLLMKQFCLDT